MATSVWKSTRFGDSTITRAMTMLKLAIKRNMKFEEICRLLCYYLERCRQSRNCSAHHFLQSCVKSNHRYAKGKHRINYLKGGMTILTCMAERVGLDPGTPANAVLDKILEHPELLDGNAEEEDTEASSDPFDN